MKTLPLPFYYMAIVCPDHEQDDARVRVYNADVDGYNDKERYFAPRLHLLPHRAPDLADDRDRSRLSHQGRGLPTVVGARGAGPARPSAGAGKAARMHACAR